MFDPTSFPAGSTFLIDGIVIKPLSESDGSIESYIDENGWVVITEEEGKLLEFLGPLHYSTPFNGDISLNLTVEVTDIGSSPGSLSNTLLEFYQIDVKIAGVAKGQDEPFNVTIITLAEEDEDYNIGKYINLTEVLVDNDGSEVLYLTLTGLPSDVAPFTDYINPETNEPCKDSVQEGCPGIVAIAGQPGAWAIGPSAIAGLKLPAVKNYSGDQPYEKLRIFAQTQEFDQDLSGVVEWQIQILVTPEVVSDAISPFDISVSVTEEENELGRIGVSLAALSLLENQLADPDSERVLEYTIDLSYMIDDAQIYQRLVDLNPNATDYDVDLLLIYLDGTYTNNGNGTITVKQGFTGGLLFDAILFWDSNESFRLEAWALIEDRALLNGIEVSVTTIVQGYFNVILIGTADVPTVEASPAEGGAGELILMDIGGNSTDSDPELGRNQSESLYYVMSLVDFDGNLSGWVFTDANGNVVGFEGGGNTWIFPYETMLSDIYFKSDKYADGVATFNFTSIALEDGTNATNSILFDIEIFQNATCEGSDCEGKEPPCEPSLNLDNQTGLEDEDIVIDWYDILTQNCEGSDDTFSVVFNELPDGVTVTGKGVFYNTATGYFVASGAGIRSGNVKVSAPEDFSGLYTIQGKGSKELLEVIPWLQKLCSNTFNTC